MRKLILIFFLSSPAMATGPKFVGTKTDVPTYKEFVNVYADMPAKTITPRFYTGGGAPTFTPPRVADIYVSTTTGKVYIATGSANSGSWAILN